MKVFYFTFFALIGLIVYVVINIIGSERMHKNTLLAFVGSMGTGKTKLAVDKSLSALKKARLKWWVKKIIPISRRPYCKGWKSLLPIQITPQRLPKPQLYSNIPIRISSKEMSCKLTADHLKDFVIYSDKNKYWEYKAQFIPNSIVLIDELGQFASQYDWNLQSVQKGLVPLIRFCRHWGLKLYCTDQTADSIAKGIRSRLGMIYFLNDFRRPFLLFYKVKTIPMIIAEDNISTTDNNKGDKFKYFFGWLGKKGKHYDSLCHSELYKRNRLDYEKHNSTTLKSDYFIDLN